MERTGRLTDKADIPTNNKTQKISVTLLFARTLSFPSSKNCIKIFYSFYGFFLSEYFASKIYVYHNSSFIVIGILHLKTVLRPTHLSYEKYEVIPVTSTISFWSIKPMSDSFSSVSYTS